MAFVEQRRHDLRRRTVDEAWAGEHIEDLLATRLHTAPGRALDGAAGARELTSDDGRRSPVTRPVLGRPAPRRPAPQAVGPPSRARSRVRGSIPAARQLSPARPGSCARCATRAPGEPLADLEARAPSHPAGCVRPVRAALLRGQLPQRALAPRLAPSRHDASCTTPRAKQAAHLAGLCAAIRLLQNPQPILCAELAPLRLGHNLRVRGRSGAAGSGGRGA